MKTKIVLLFAAGVLSMSHSALALPTSFDLEFSDVGDSGTVFFDPFDHSYDSEIENSDLDFEMAANVDGEESEPQPYMGDMSATDFHLEFNFTFEVSDDDEEVVQFVHVDDVLGEILWETVITEDSIWFLAPTGVLLEVGELFQIEVEQLFFADNIDQLAGTATWTGVPESGTLWLMGIGLLGFHFARPRRKPA